MILLGRREVISCEKKYVENIYIYGTESSSFEAELKI